MLVNIPKRIIDDAYEVAEKFVRHACEDSESEEEFQEEIAFCQVMAARLLAVLAFNSFVQDTENRTLRECIDMVTKMVTTEVAVMADEYAAGKLKDVMINVRGGGENGSDQN